MAPNLNYEIPTWSQIYDMLVSQAEKIRSSSYCPELIIGIVRGGIIPARILADLLETEIATIQIEFYSNIGQTKTQPVLKQPLTKAITGKKVLLVDDIADSGQSLSLAKKHLQEQNALEIKMSTLYFKPQSIVTPDFYEKQTINWVVFPWEIQETLREIMQKNAGKRAQNQEITQLVKAGLPKQLAQRLLATMN